MAALPQVTADTEGSDTIRIMLGLITTLSLLLAGIVALGVFNTVVLNTRERVHEIGVLKSIGMSPRQVGVMVVTSMVTIGLVGGALAVPLGWALHRWILPVMGNVAGLGILDKVLTVYGPVQLVGRVPRDRAGGARRPGPRGAGPAGPAPRRPLRAE